MLKSMLINMHCETWLLKKIHCIIASRCTLCWKLLSLQWCHINLMATREFVQQFTQANIKGTYYWPFVKGIHRWPVDSLHKGPVMQKAFPCPDLIMFLPEVVHGYGYVRFCVADYSSPQQTQRIHWLFMTTISRANIPFPMGPSSIIGLSDMTDRPASGV